MDELIPGGGDVGLTTTGATVPDSGGGTGISIEAAWAARESGGVNTGVDGGVRTGVGGASTEVGGVRTGVGGADTGGVLRMIGTVGNDRGLPTVGKSAVIGVGALGAETAIVGRFVVGACGKLGRGAVDVTVGALVMGAIAGGLPDSGAGTGISMPGSAAPEALTATRG